MLGDFVSSLASTGFLAPDEPQALRTLFRSFNPQSLLDLGCGSGGLGIWLASELGYDRYLGIDRQPPAMTLPTSVAGRSFAAQSFETLDLKASDPFSAVLSHDALYLASDPLDLLRRVRAGLREDGQLVATLYVAADVWEGGIGGRSLDDWVRDVDQAGFRLRQIEDLTDDWRFWAGRLHRERLRLCRRAGTPGPTVQRLAAISRRMLGLDGRRAFLQRVGRFRLHAHVDQARYVERRRSFDVLG